MRSTETLVLRLALDGLSDPQSVIDPHYAASLLPEPFKSGWADDLRKLEEFYDDRDTAPYAWDECATPRMKLYHSNVTKWVNECITLANKGITDKRISVENLNSSRYATDFNQMSDDEKSWFVPLSEKHDWRRKGPKVRFLFGKFQTVMFQMYPVDQLEPWDNKVRNMTTEWVREAVKKTAS